jgi:hypothetical protein
MDCFDADRKPFSLILSELFMFYCLPLIVSDELIFLKEYTLKSNFVHETCIGKGAFCRRMNRGGLGRREGKR